SYSSLRTPSRPSSFRDFAREELLDVAPDLLAAHEEWDLPLSVGLLDCESDPRDLALAARLAHDQVDGAACNTIAYLGAPAQPLHHESGDRITMKPLRY